MKLLKFRELGLILLLFLILGCPPIPNPQEDPHTPDGNQVQPTPNPQNDEITESEILNAFSLSKGEERASVAAKKIANESNGTGVAAITFESCEALAYDDEAGTFSVKVKGQKDSKGFDKEFDISGFRNPYDANIVSVVEEVTFNFNEAMENDTKLSDFITAGNHNLGSVLVNAKFKIGSKTLTVGTTDDYRLNFTLSSIGSDVIKLTADYNVKFQKKRRGDAFETSEMKNNNALFNNISENLKKPYFTLNELYLYLLDKAGDGILQVYSNRFASEFYSLSKNLSVTHGDLLSNNSIQTIIDKYSGTGGQYQIEIDSAIFNPRNEGILADDYKGSITVNYCIASKNQIQDMLGGVTGYEPIVAISTFTKSGYKMIDSDVAKSLFQFEVSVTNPSEWNKLKLNNFYLLKKGPSDPSGYDTYIVSDLKKAGSYELKVNESDPIDVFATEPPKCFSVGKNGELIFLEEILLDKEEHSDTLKVRIKFVGEIEGGYLDWEVSP